MKKLILISILTTLSVFVIGGLLGSYYFIPKINRLADGIEKQKERGTREDFRDVKLKKEATFFVSNYSYKETFNLNIYKDYFVIKGDYCNVDEHFFDAIEENLRKKNIIYKPKITVNKFNFSDISYLKDGRRIKKDNTKAAICAFALSKIPTNYIELEIESYRYSDAETQNLKNYVLVGSHTLAKYSKLSAESLANSENLINKISNELIYPNENISVMEKLLNNGGNDLVKSNILKDGEIIQGIGGGSCLASTIIYRTLLDAGIAVRAQKTHNIYYENIYGTSLVGLDSTIYEDNTFLVDLLFQNNYTSPVIFVPVFNKGTIELRVYAKEKEYNTKLTPIDLVNTNAITWKYELFDKNKRAISEKTIVAKYERVDKY